VAVKLFSYRRGNTLLHRIPAGIKILFLMGISIAVFAGKHVNVSVTVICGAFAMVGGLILVPLVSLITKKPDKELVADVFSCYENKVLVPVTEALSNTSE